MSSASSAGLLEAPYSARLIPASSSSGLEWSTQYEHVHEASKSKAISEVNISEAKEEIATLYLTHRKSNWDGYGALPISRAACFEAMRFLTMLPEAVEMPEVVPEPDGNIALEWYKSKYEHLFVSFSGNGVVTFVGKFGQLTRSEGVEYFFASIPLRILHDIRQMISLKSHS